MTGAEFENKYQDVLLTFSGYYKYQFNFSGVAPDGVSIIATYGGNSDDIYKFEVGANEERVLGSIYDSWHMVQAYKNKEQIFSHSDY